ncbi:MAG: thioredoxin [Lachnospiraceae bacterium]|nr:thioredoxin [Lachnospiraceae bacterium]MDY5742426.1 thioredoxin [Lachnospiraceae bacterium]
MLVVTITKDNFQQVVLDAQGPVLVDFWASWCGPCKMLSPLVDEVAAETAGKAVVGKVNVDEQPELAQKFGVMSIPTLLVFNKGEVVQTSVGAVPKAKILALLGL